MLGWLSFSIFSPAQVGCRQLTASKHNTYNTCCLSFQPANNLTFNEIAIVTAEDKNSSVVCNSDALDGDDLDALGFECQNGPYTIGSSSDTGSDDAVITKITSIVLYAVAAVGIALYWQ